MKNYFFLFLILLSSCSRSPLQNSKDAMRPVSVPPQLLDHLTRESFFTTLKNHISIMKTSRQVNDPMVFGERKIEKAQYILALEKILEHSDDWTDWISKNFDFYEVYGRKSWGEVMSTGYYEPKVLGSKTRTDQFSQAIYSTPKDLMTLRLINFGNKLSPSKNVVTLTGRLENKNFYPYYDRKQIDVDNRLEGKNLELAWVEPIDSFIIQIQGSGTIEFNTGEIIRIGYDGQNGHPYEAIGKHLTQVIPLEDMSMQKIKKHLKSLPMIEQQKILNLNPSYVFFKKLESEAITYAGMEVSSGRTIATDYHIFPKGALAYLDIKEPLFETLNEEVPTRWENRPRLVFDQDTGGAIKGAGRVDLFFGKGEEASLKAGVMKQIGRLYYLVPR
jgi:membrane-bound lytic murein transglycosylase A